MKRATRILWVPLLMVLSCKSVWASDREVGNGGDVLVCQKAKAGKVTYQSLDLFEAVDRRGMEIAYPSLVDQDPISMAYQVIDRLGELSPHRRKVYKAWASQFMIEALFRKDIELVNVDDSKHLYLPKGCVLEQIIVQQTVRFSGDARYIVNADLWDKLNSYEKAAFIVHEVILREYRELHKNDTVDSRAVRYFNSMLWADRIDKLNISEFVEFIQSLPLEYVEFGGAQIRVYTPKDDLNDEFTWDPMYYPSGRVESARVVEQSTVTQGGYTFVLKDWGDHPLQNTIRFHENGVISRIWLWEPISIEIKGKTYTLWGKIDFDEDGQIARADGLPVLSNF